MYRGSVGKRVSPTANNPLVGSISLLAFALLLYSGACAVRVLLAIASVLSTFFGSEGPLPGLWRALVLGGVSGACAGVAIAVVRVVLARRGQPVRQAAEKGTDKALEERLLEGMDARFWAHVAFAIAVGFVTGAVDAAGGIRGLFPLWDGSAGGSLHADALPAAVLLGGGFGGAGGGSFWALAFFVLVVVILSLLVAVAAAVGSHLVVMVVGGLANTVREGAKEGILGLMEEEVEDEENGGRKKRKPFVAALARGFAVGAATGLVHGIFTAGEAAGGSSQAASNSPEPAPAPAPVPVATDAGSQAAAAPDDWTRSLTSETCPEPCCAGSACAGNPEDCTPAAFTCIPGECEWGFQRGQRWNLVLYRIVASGGERACDPQSPLSSASVCLEDTDPPACVPIAESCKRGKATTKIPIVTEDLIHTPHAVVIRDGDNVIARRSGILYPRGLKRTALCRGAILRGFEKTGETGVETITFLLEPRREP
jgi:hypothetical protein